MSDTYPKHLAQDLRAWRRMKRREWRAIQKAVDAFALGFVREGRIEFLSDCTHALAGQTVPLIPWPDPTTPTETRDA